MPWNLWNSRRKRRMVVQSSVLLPPGGIDGVTMVLSRRVKSFSRLAAVLHTPAGTAVPLTPRDYILVRLPSISFPDRKQNPIASLSLYFTPPGIARLRSCPAGTELEICFETVPKGKETVQPSVRKTDRIKAGRN